MESTQRSINDADLLILLNDQPDGLLTPHQLAEKSGISLNDARIRLSALFSEGVLIRSHNRQGRYFYQLRLPFSPSPAIEFSQDPFLTVEDLLLLFQHKGGRLTIQEMILATRLPLTVLKRELKHFEKEGVIQRLNSYDHSSSSMSHKFLVLQEPYRSDPTAFKAKAGEMDLQLREILLNENLIV